jgi:hypothetical protein
VILCVARIREAPHVDAMEPPRCEGDKLRCPSGPTEAEWEQVEPLILPAKRGGGKRRVNMRG